MLGKLRKLGAAALLALAFVSSAADADARPASYELRTVHQGGNRTGYVLVRTDHKPPVDRPYALTGDAEGQSPEYELRTVHQGGGRTGYVLVRTDR